MGKKSARHHGPQLSICLAVQHALEYTPFNIYFNETQCIAFLIYQFQTFLINLIGLSFQTGWNSTRPGSGLGISIYNYIFFS